MVELGKQTHNEKLLLAVIDRLLLVTANQRAALRKLGEILDAKDTGYIPPIVTSIVTDVSAWRSALSAATEVQVRQISEMLVAAAQVTPAALPPSSPSDTSD